jgi:acetyltransferase-like isoleucine patch superfamily enzyme
MSTLKTINIVHPSGSPTNLVLADDGSLTVANKLTVSNNATFSNSITVSNNVIISNNATVTSNVSANNITVTKNITIGNNISVSNNLTVSNSATITGDLTVSGTIYGVSSSAPSSYNYVINGGMDVWQRGSAGFTTDVLYTADRWWLVNDSVGTARVSRVGIGTLGIGTRYALRAERTVGTNRWVVGTNLEVADFQKLIGKTITVSFKLRKGAGLTSDIAVSVGSTSTEAKFGSLINDGSINVTNASLNTSTFTQFSTTFTIPSSSAAVGFKIEFAANQAGTTNAYFDVTDVKLEIGSTVTPFVHRAYGAELALCQRYYQYSQFVYFPSTVAATVYYKVSMRRIPDLTWAGSGGGNFYNATTENVTMQSSSNSTAALTLEAEL